MSFSAAVRAEHQADIIVIQPLDIGIIQSQSIGGQGKLENLAGFLLALSHILGNMLHQRHVDERLATEKVNLAVLPWAAMVDDVINCRLAYLLAHHLPLTAILAGIAEAVFAAHVAVMSRHQAEGLHQPLGLEGRRHINIRGKQLLNLHEMMQLLQSLLHITGRVHAVHGLLHLGIVLPVKIVHHVINHLIHHMHGTAVHIQQDIHAVLHELVDFLLHFLVHPFSPINCKLS